MQNKELLPRDPAVPPSIFTPTFFHIRIYPNHLVCTTSHLLAENFQRGEENPPSLNKNKNHLCERKSTSSETLGSNYGKPRATVQAFSDGGGWGRWFISCISSAVNSTIPFHFIFSPLLTCCCQEIFLGNTHLKHNSRKWVSSQYVFQENYLGSLQQMAMRVHTRTAGFRMSKL